MAGAAVISGRFDLNWSKLARLADLCCKARWGAKRVRPSLTRRANGAGAPSRPATEKTVRQARWASCTTLPPTTLAAAIAPSR